MSLKRPNGMTQFAWEAYQAASDAANINIAASEIARVVQAYGNAVPSAGTHLYEPRTKDPQHDVERFKLDGEFYSAAADLSVMNPTRLTNTQIATWIEELCRAGFIAFYRTAPFSPHIHTVYAGVRMKPILLSQCKDFFAARNGLVSHTSIEDKFWCPSDTLRDIPRAMFKESNGNNPQPVRSPIMHGKVDVALPTYALFLNDNLILHMPVIDGVALAPVRAWGSALGFDVNWIPEKQSVQFVQKDGKVVDLPIAIKLIAKVGHAPIRQLAAFSNLKLSVDNAQRKVTITR